MKIHSQGRFFYVELPNGQILAKYDYDELLMNINKLGFNIDKKLQKKPTKITYAQVRSFTDQFDHNCSDGWIEEILNGDVNIDKMKTFILNNYQEHQDENGNKLLDEDIEGYFTKNNCQEIFNEESK